jgi:hypothetical protein
MKSALLFSAALALSLIVSADAGLDILSNIFGPKGKKSNANSVKRNEDPNDETLATTQIPARIDSHAIREAKKQQKDLAERLGVKPDDEAPTGKSKARKPMSIFSRQDQTPVSGHVNGDEQEHDDDDDDDDVDDDDDDDYDEEAMQHCMQQKKDDIDNGKAYDPNFARRKNFNMLKQQFNANNKQSSFVRTTKDRTAESGNEARQQVMDRIRQNIALKENDELEKKEKKTCEALTAKYWGKKLKGAKKAYKAVEEKVTAEMVGMAKGINSALDNFRASRPCVRKVERLIHQANKAGSFVREEFAKITMVLSPIIEDALEFIGDQNLNNLKWDPVDEIDYRRDALHALAIGYEFMMIMIIWRENLLVAHEAYKFWLESLVESCKDTKKKFSLKRLRFSPAEVHNYMLLLAWDEIQFDMLESRMSLEYVSNLEEMRPKNYESKFFRHVVRLQEYYVATIAEIERERDETMPALVDQTETASAFLDFKQLVDHQVLDIDVKVPEKLTEFMTKLQPQLRRSKRLYSTEFLRELDFELAKAKQERRIVMDDESVQEGTAGKSP